MNELNVRKITLEPMRVASAYGFGSSPEEIAWGKLLDWAKSKGLLGADNRFFGFDNPHPTPGSPNYGYEQWLVVGPDTVPDGDIEIKDFPGGTYAVLRCKNVYNITETWRALLGWYEDHYAHCRVTGLCLEECLTPPGTPYEDMVFDLYLAIEE